MGARLACVACAHAVCCCGRSSGSHGVFDLLSVHCSCVSFVSCPALCRPTPRGAKKAPLESLQAPCVLRDVVMLLNVTTGLSIYVPACMGAPLACVAKRAKCQAFKVLTVSMCSGALASLECFFGSRAPSLGCGAAVPAGLEARRLLFMHVRSFLELAWRSCLFSCCLPRQLR